MRITNVVVTEGANLHIQRINPNVTKIKIKGSKGEVERTFKAKDLNIEIKDGKVYVTTSENPMINTILSHIKNMIIGVTEGYEKHMIIRYSHFPINLEIKGDKVNIKNFIGERKNRTTKIAGKSKITIKGPNLVIQGVDKEEVSQTAANLRKATKIKQKDSRIFQDGIYSIIEDR